jgi:hypothetical protein
MNMKTKNRLNFVLAGLLLAGLLLACKFGDETEKANELIAKANKSITAANEAGQKGLKRIAEMEEMAGKIASDDDLKETRAVAGECKETFGKARDGYKEASEGFSGASKLKVNEKFKEYCETKAAELLKRSEMMTAGAEEAEAMIKSENRNEYQTQVKTITEKFNKLKGEADELAKKADKIQADNKDVFKEL